MSRLISLGSKGQDVRAIQDVLNFQIRRLDPLDVDGDFGSKTRAHVIEFQTANKLTADGIVGPKTLAKLFEEEVMSFSMTLLPQLTLPPFVQRPAGIQPPRLIPPLTLDLPVSKPFLLPPDSFTLVPPLTPRGQTLNFNLTTPAHNDPLDPAVASFNQIMRLLNTIPQNFPFRATLIGAVPAPVKKVGPLQLDPVSPMSFGFKWGVKPLFDLKSIGPPVEFRAGAAANARYTLQIINRPGATVPQLGIFAQGDFKGLVDWTSQKAQSKPLLDVSGSVILGAELRF